MSSERTILGHKPQHRIQTVAQARSYFGDHVYERLGARLFTDLLDPVYRDPRFWRWPASTSKHHVFEGGLAVHTAQVCDSMDTMLQTVRGARVHLALVAGVWHDYGKIWDYKWDVGPLSDENWREERWQNTTHKLAIGQIPRSYHEFMKTAEKCGGYVLEDLDFVGHLILSHHGRPEWGSAVTPHCVEALTLHAADMLSAWYCQSEEVK
jgi:3'-5' exoribonuclease